MWSTPAAARKADFLADFPGAVRFAVVQVPGESDVGGEAGHRAGSAGDGDVGAGDEHARADDVAFGDGVAQGDVGERAVDADIADGGEAGFEEDTSVGDGLERHFGASVFELIDGIDVALLGAVGEVGVAVDQAGEDGEGGEVDGLGGRRDWEIGADCGDFAVGDEDDLVGEDAGVVDVDEFAGADGGDLWGRGLLLG